MSSGAQLHQRPSRRILPAARREPPIKTIRKLAGSGTVVASGTPIREPLVKTLRAYVISPSLSCALLFTISRDMVPPALDRKGTGSRYRSSKAVSEGFFHGRH